MAQGLVSLVEDIAVYPRHKWETLAEFSAEGHGQTCLSHQSSMVWLRR